jgi:hypothetical protein
MLGSGHAVVDSYPHSYPLMSWAPPDSLMLFAYYGLPPSAGKRCHQYRGAPPSAR